MIMDKKEFRIDERKGLITKIPGFRSNKTIKKVIAAMYYGFWALGCISSISIGDFAVGMAMFIMFPIGCYIFDIIIDKNKRNSKNVIMTVVIPAIAFVTLMNISISDDFNISAEDKALEELGISYLEYNQTMLKYEELVVAMEEIEKANKTQLENYNKKVEELELINAEFEEYKAKISEDKVQEHKDLEAENENYINKKSSLEAEIDELKSRLR